MPRELSKCREWEKDRRDRLKDCFNVLYKLLPCYDPSRTLSKIEILQKTTVYIEDLQQKIKNTLTSDGIKKTEKDEVKRLYDRINKLLSRNEQLSNLLKDAGIKLPLEYGSIKEFRESFRWSNKISSEQAKMFASKEAQKENKKMKLVTTGRKKCNLKKSGGHRKITSPKLDKKKSKLLKKKVTAVVAITSSTGMAVLPQPNFTGKQPCYIITNASSANLPINLPKPVNSKLVSTSTTSTIKTTSSVLTRTNPSLTSLGPGTLILADGSILPVLPQPILPNSSPILVNSTNNSNTTLIVFPNTTRHNDPTTNVTVTSSISTQTKTSSNVKVLTRIRPKRDLTKTTQINKVPIPALTSRYSLLPTRTSKPVKTKSKKKDVPNLELKKTEDNKTTANKAVVEKEVAESNKSSEKCNLTDDIKSDSKRIKLDDNKQETLENDQTNAEIAIDISLELIESTNEKDCTNEKTVGENIDQVDTSIKSTEILENKKPDENKNEEENATPEVPISDLIDEQNSDSKKMDLSLNIPHSELSNDIFASLQVGSHNPESTSPTAAFLLAFPLVSTLTGVKVAEVNEEENSDSQRGTPTLLQIGAIDTTKPAQSENLTPSILNLDGFTFFSSKDMCSNFYSPFESLIPTSTISAITSTISTSLAEIANENVLNSAVTPRVNERAEKDIKKITELPCSKATKTFKKSTSDPVNVSNSLERKSESGHFQFNTKTPLLNNSCNETAPLTKPSPFSFSANPQVIHTNQQKPQFSTAVVSSCGTSNFIPKSKSFEQNFTYPITSTASMGGSHLNTFNSFTDFAKTTTIYSYNTNSSKLCGEPLYTNSSNYSYYSNENLHQNSYNNIGKGDTRMQNLQKYETNCNVYKNVSKKPVLKTNQFPNYYSQPQSQSKDKYGHIKPKANDNQMKPPINWMTTPDIRQQSTDYLISPFNKDLDFSSNSFYPPNSFMPNTQSTYFNTNAPIYQSSDFQNINDNRKHDTSFPVISSSSLPRNELDENQFSWSPTKLPQMLETPHNYVSSTLPALVGDLALGTTQQTGTFIEQNDKDIYRNRDVKTKSTNFDNQSNFLSVSQLVDHNKPNGVPSRTTNRRPSVGRPAKNNPQKLTKRNQHKPLENKDTSGASGNYNLNKMDKNDSVKHQQNSDYFGQGIQPPWSDDKIGKLKNSQSSYSAEALIGNQKYQQQISYPPTSKPLPVSTFLPDNIIPYFPTVDLSAQDNSFMQQGQNYQSNTFSQNYPSTNAYSSSSFMPSGPTITSSYLPSSNIIPDISSHDYNSVMPDNFNLFPHSSNAKQYSKYANVKNGHLDNKGPTSSQPNNSTCSINSSNNCGKKTKRKHSNESNLPGIVDFSFLPMPGAINSPILPDDFHAHSNFLPPPTPSQLYPCKNPLYTKSSTDISSNALLPIPPHVPPVSRCGIPPQQPETSPLISSNVGTSVTNFNLSTIFPEINKGSSHLPDIYSQSSRNKDYSVHRNYIGNSIQVPYNIKSSFTHNHNSTTHS